jgi:hypothetical protein
MTSSSQGPSGRLLAFWFEPLDPVRLDSFRRAFAASLLIYLGTWFMNAYEWLTDHGFHYTAATERAGLAPPLPTLPPALVPWFGLLVLVCTGALMLGWKPRLFTWLTLGVAVYAQLVDQNSAFTINKLFIVGFLILALAPAVRRIPGDDGRPVERQSAWPLRTLQATLLIGYATAGWCKIFHGNWLGDPDILWTQVQGSYRTETAAWMLRILPKAAWSAMMYAALAFEVAAPVLFTVRRLRGIAFVVGIGFHLLIAVTMNKLILFSLQFLTFYLLFLGAGEIHALRAWFAGSARLAGSILAGRRA